LMVKQCKWRVVDPKQDARAQGDTSFNCKEEDGPERTFYIAATSTTERDGWLGMLRIIQMIQWLKEETTALHHELHEVMPSLQRVDIDLASFQFLEPNLSALFDPVHLETNDESTTTVVNFRRPPDGSQLKVVRKAYLELVAKHSISSSVRSITFVFYTDKKAHKEGLKRSKDDGSISIIVPCFQGHGIVTEIVEKDIVDFVYEHL